MDLASNGNVTLSSIKCEINVGKVMKFDPYILTHIWCFGSLMLCFTDTKCLLFLVFYLISVLGDKRVCDLSFTESKC